jgi:hypothetical protein
MAATIDVARDGPLSDPVSGCTGVPGEQPHHALGVVIRLAPQARAA